MTTQAELKALFATNKAEKIEATLPQIEALGFSCIQKVDTKTGEVYASVFVGKGKHSAVKAFTIQAYLFGVVNNRGNTGDIENLEVEASELYATAYSRAAIQADIRKNGGDLEQFGFELNPMDKTPTKNIVKFNFTVAGATATWNDGQTLPVRSGIWTQAQRTASVKSQAQSLERVKAMYTDAAKPVAKKGKAVAK